MIVRNEDHVILRCLRSVLPLITHWLIIDTGSTDGTQTTIRTFMGSHGVAGELLERPWVNFAHNRTESLTAASRLAEYLLLIDADEYIEAERGFTLPHLTADVYSLQLVSGPYTYPKMQLIRADAGWRFVGVIHEHLTLDRPYEAQLLPGLRTIRIRDGARARDPLTFRRDALLLEEALLREPTNSRYMFYLAQSYADGHEYGLAIDRYQRRIAMGGWEEEVWSSMYQIAKLREYRGDPWPEIQHVLLEAFSRRPTRAEPLFRIGVHYQKEQNFPLAHLFFSAAMQIPYPVGEVIYVEHEVYNFFLPLEYAVSCFYVGQHEPAIRTANNLLGSASLTDEQRDRVIRNRQYSLDALFPPSQQTAPSPDPSPSLTSRLWILLLDPGSPGQLDATLRSVRLQTEMATTVILQPPVSPAADLTLPSQEPGISFRAYTPGASWIEYLLLASADAAPGDILLPLPAGAVLADKRCLADLAALFDRYRCTALQTQFRWSDGALGNAMPLAAAADLHEAFFAHTPVLLAFRRELLDELSPSTASSPVHLLQAAGYRRIRFTDRPLALLPRNDGCPAPGRS